ncbi:hypothetical protein L249_7641 [Ophiocordyceps polyrhachis-furcata BCC 54312]|uniref:Tetraspanin Tsp3 n=1 Tax=Ophiocordyceps polyrhachis-furcata BCC 54312 TaxID=1330021 RepID=A0A367L9X5_9HYPO|nr:hypothetical protein L249_7641 [Ophiocordyceps polyrhachis-furcata BCC 54312]
MHTSCILCLQADMKRIIIIIIMIFDFIFTTTPSSKMPIWLLVHLLLVLLLLAIAIYEHVTSTSLSLPLRPSLTITTIILPILSAANAIFYQRFLLRSASAAARRRTLPRAMTLQALQAILTVVMATLFFSDMMPSVARTCLLSHRWQRLFSSRDVDSIRRIQDALNCCGFRTVLDRPWPFPGSQGARECADTYRRDVPCSQPWQMAMQRNCGVEFGLVIAIGFWQILSLILPLRTMSQSRTANDDDSRRRLLPDATAGDGPRREREQDDQNDASRDNQPNSSLLEL